jgi:signal peptidase I
MHREPGPSGRARVYRAPLQWVKSASEPGSCIGRAPENGVRERVTACRDGGPYTAGLVSQRPALGCLFEIVETLVLTLIIFLVIQNFVAQPYKVQQQSMERTLEPEQYVLVDKLTPRFDTYKRGDIVVFTPPADWGEDGTPFIKRVIGEGGDDLVYINGEPIDEPYLYSDEPGGPPQLTTAPLDRASWTIPIGELFLMGDHRSNSADSRTFGPVEVDHVIGRAWLRYWPLSTFGILATPEYPDLSAATP